MKKNTTELTRLTGVENMRDLGGYPTKDGRTIKNGIFYRGAASIKLSSKQQEGLSRLGLKTLFDFRSEYEVRLNPDMIPAGCLYINASGIQDMGSAMDEMSENGNLDMKTLLKKADGNREMIDMLDGYLVDGYRQMARSPVAFATFFKHLLDSNGTPVLFHCTAGKDRTGICAALILRVLGVSQEVVTEDYLLSNRYRKAEIWRTMFLLNLAVRDRRLKESIRKMLGVQQEFLQAFFDEVNAVYGSFDAFVNKGLELTDVNIKHLKSISLN